MTGGGKKEGEGPLRAPGLGERRDGQAADVGF